MTVASISRRPEVAGLGLWAVALAAIPAPLAARLWLAVPLVLVPRLAPALAAGHRAGPLAAQPWTSVAAGVMAAASLAVPTGSPLAGALAAPWLMLALAGLTASVPRRTDRPAVDAPGRIAAHGFLVVGAGFVLLERLAVAPLGYDPTIVLLTAVHFSVAGYTLVALAALRARVGSRAAGWAVGALVVGIPMTAVGWSIATPVAAWPGSLVVAAGGLLVAAAIAGGGRSVGGRTAAVAVVSSGLLAVGMMLAIGWATALLLGVPYLDMAGMVRTHGAANLVAVLLAATLVHVSAGSADLAGRNGHRLRGGAIGFMLGLPAWCWISMTHVGFLSQAVVATSALVGPTAAGWLMGGGPTRHLADRFTRIVGMVGLTVVLACLFIASAEAVDARSVPESLMAFAWLSVVGLLWVGWFAALAAIPFALVWVWATDRWGRRATR